MQRQRCLRLCLSAVQVGEGPGQAGDGLGTSVQRCRQVIDGDLRLCRLRKGLFARACLQRGPTLCPQPGGCLRGVALGLPVNDGLCQRLQMALGLLPLLPFKCPLLQPWLGVRRQGIAGLK